MSISSQENCTPQCDDTWLCFGQHTGDSGKINLLLGFIEATRLVKLREMDALIASRLRLFLHHHGRYGSVIRNVDPRTLHPQLDEQHLTDGKDMIISEHLDKDRFHAFTDPCMSNPYKQE